MKKTIILSAAALFLMLTSCNNSSNKTEQKNVSDSTKTVASSQLFNLDTTKLKSGEKFYQCEMNLEIISDKPGTCPTCGMDLSEMKKH